MKTIQVKSTKNTFHKRQSGQEPIHLLNFSCPCPCPVKIKVPPQAYFPSTIQTDQSESSTQLCRGPPPSQTGPPSHFRLVPTPLIFSPIIAPPGRGGLTNVVPWHHSSMAPSLPALPESALWAGYVFLRKYTAQFHFSGDSCGRKYGFQP